MSVVTPFPAIYNYKDSSIVASWDSKVSTGLCIITYYYYYRKYTYSYMSLVCFKVIHNKSPIKSHQGQRTFVVFPRHRQLASYVPEAHPWVPAGYHTLQHYPSILNKYFIHVLYENGQRQSVMTHILVKMGKLPLKFSQHTFLIFRCWLRALFLWIIHLMRHKTLLWPTSQCCRDDVFL